MSLDGKGGVCKGIFNLLLFFLGEFGTDMYVLYYTL
ncbi:MAG: hypothetical protein CEO22_209, partial [Candidatus Berkelbacteria bacterium Gr01-1014_85]